jgi:hypothetical protein
MFALYVLLTLAALVLAGAVSPARGFASWLSLLVLAWTVGQFNTLIEAVVFSVMPMRDALVQLAIALVAMALVAAIAVSLIGKWRGSSPAAVHPTVNWRVVAGVVLGYELLYWTAGTLVWPFVASFYANKPMPAAASVAALQVPRALIFAAAAWPWLRTGPRRAPWVLGAAFAVIGGIAPMLPENPYMPADVRFAHGIETSVSNFLFGLLVGWLLRAKAVSAGSIGDR